MLYILYQSSVFDDVVRLVKTSLQKQGLYPVVTTTVRASTSASNDYYIIIGAHDLVGDLPENYEVYQFEQVNSEGVKNWFECDHGAQYIKVLQRSNVTYDYSSVNALLLKDRFGLDVEFLPLGYNGGIKLEQGFKQKSRDVVFFGSINERRKEIFADLAAYGNEVYAPQTIWRDERSKIARGAKIALNIHFYPCATLETTRLLDLLSNQCFVISEPSTDPELDRIYGEMVVFSPKNKLAETVNYWLQPENASKRQDFANNAYYKFKDMNFIYPVNENMKTCSSSAEAKDTLPEPDNLKFREASIIRNKDGSVSLALNKTPAIDDMPSASVLTITRDRKELFEIAVSNWRRFRYTDNRLEWVIVDDSPVDQISNLLKGMKNVKYVHVPSSVPMEIAAKRNLATNYATHNILINMDDDDYYYPLSCYARVKTLVDSDAQCIGCDSFGVYHLRDNYDFKITTNNLSEASMCYYRSFWEEQKFAPHGRGESIPFLKNRRSKVLTIPHEFVFVAITHGDNYTRSLRALKEGSVRSHAIFNSLDFETQLLLNKVYRKLCRHQSREVSNSDNV